MSLEIQPIFGGEDDLFPFDRFPEREATFMAQKLQEKHGELIFEIRNIDGFDAIWTNYLLIDSTLIKVYGKNVYLIHIKVIPINLEGEVAGEELILKILPRLKYSFMGKDSNGEPALISFMEGFISNETDSRASQ